MVRYLGIQLDDKLNLCAYIDMIRIKITKGLGMLKICKHFLPIKCLI